MKRLPWIGLAATAALLAACHRPATKEAAAPPPSAPAVTAVPVGVERAGPVQWNATAGAFELGGKPLKTVKLWTFDGSTEGFTTVRSTIAPAAGQGALVTLADPTLRSPKGLNVPGSQFPVVLVRLTRAAAGSLWDGALYYSTTTHGEAVKYFGKPISGADPKVGETTTLVYDMRRQAQGAPDWTQSTIDQIRLDIEDKAGGAFVIRQIAIAEAADPAALGEPAAAPPEPAAEPAPEPATAKPKAKAKKS